MTEHWPELRRRIGRRGVFLAFLVVLDAIYGYFLLAVPLPGHQEVVMPQTGWAICWLVTATVCFVSIPFKKDYAAFTVAAVMKCAWAARSAFLWYLGVPHAWSGVVVWLVFAFTVVVIAGWPEPPVSELPPEPGRESK